MGMATSSAQGAADKAFEQALSGAVLVRDALGDLSPRLIAAARALRLVRRAAAPNHDDTDDDSSESGTDTSPGDEAKPATELELILGSTDEQLRVAQSLVDRVRRAVRHSSPTTSDQGALRAIAEDSTKVWQETGVGSGVCFLRFPVCCDLRVSFCQHCLSISGFFFFFFFLFTP